MCLQGHFFILNVTILFLSFSLFCLAGYPFQNDINTRKYATNYSNDEMANVDNVKHSRRRDRARFQSGFLPGPLAPTSAPRVVSVDDYSGSNIHTDDTEAFRKAWKEACSSTAGVFLVPENKKYRVKPIKFSGPCRSHFTIKILGTIEASDNITDYRDRKQWLVFKNMRNFHVQGGGIIDGKGKIWWENSCKINKTRPCKHAPTAVSFKECKNFTVDGLRTRNAQQMHLSFYKCAIVRVSNLVISAPANSPNTDGIHITKTTNIVITRSVIETGDDCISIVSGSKNVEATDIACGPGHGISIGSLGKGGSKAHVSNILVTRVRFSGTTNGVRIKTWQGGCGYVENIVFENITMQNVSNPIIIDQHYCDQEKPCHKMNSAVQVKHVVYKNIKGTSATQVAIKVECTKTQQCRGIAFDDVNLVREGQKQAIAHCYNVELFNRGKVSPTCSQNF